MLDNVTISRSWYGRLNADYVDLQTDMISCCTTVKDEHTQIPLRGVGRRFLILTQNEITLGKKVNKPLEDHLCKLRLKLIINSLRFGTPWD